MSKVRNSNPCDGCTIRRVKCEAKRPCSECRNRGIECTVLRARKKRGPKGGPRAATRSRVEEFQRTLLQPRTQASPVPASRPIAIQQPSGWADDENDHVGNVEYDDRSGVAQLGMPVVDGWLPDSDMPLSTPTTDDRSASTFSSPSSSAARPFPQVIPLEAYRRVISSHGTQVYTIWPVVRPKDLLAKLEANECDFESYSLAAAWCAATIAQLRLPEHHVPASESNLESPSSERFCQESLRLRECFDYRESSNLAAVLTPFFLHVYYANANANKLRTAAFYLREAITFVHALGLGDSDGDADAQLDLRERSLRLRVYWVLFVSERTFAAQNGMPAILKVIDARPDNGEDLGDGTDGNLISAFTSLTKIFAYLDGSLMEPSSKSSKTPALDRCQLAARQAALCMDKDEMALFGEAQRVDLFVTRQWVRLLMWEYTTRHFPMASNSQDPAFSLYLPVRIGHEMLAHLSAVSNDGSIRTHGYGIELKVSRLADSLMDILACVPSSARGTGMLMGSGDVLYALRGVLFDVGGPGSAFLRRMEQRMEQLDLGPGARPHSLISFLGDQIARDTTTLTHNSDKENLQGQGEAARGHIYEELA